MIMKKKGVGRAGPGGRCLTTVTSFPSNALGKGDILSDTVFDQEKTHNGPMRVSWW